MGDRSDIADGNRLKTRWIMRSAPCPTTPAEIRGIDLARPVGGADRAAFYHAFVDHSVLVFRDQQLTPRQLLAGVGMFGAVFPQYNSRFALPECPEIHYISNQDFYADGKRYILRRGLSHRPLERRVAAQGHRAARGSPA